MGTEGAGYVSDAIKVNSTLLMLRLDGHLLQIKQLKGEEPVEVVNLSSQELTGTEELTMLSAIVISGLISTNKVIKSLNLAFNNIGVKGAGHLSEALQKNTSLISINLNANELGGYHNSVGHWVSTPEGTEAIAEMLKRNTTITSLSLQQNDLNDKALQYLSEGLKENKAITSLNLDRNNLTNYGEDLSGIIKLADSLKQNKTLLKLSLSDCHIKAEGAGYISEALKTNKSLTLLNLEDHPLPIKELKGEEPVDSIDLSKKNLRVLSALVIVNLISTNTATTSFNLLGNDMGNCMGIHDAEAMPQLTTLCGLKPAQTEADLSHQGLNSSDAMLLALDLGRNFVLKELNLDNNNIGGYFDDMFYWVSTPEGPAAIADMIKINSTLSSINLSCNGIGAKGAGDLSEALKINASLTSVDLAYNDIGVEGASHLSEALKTNASLTSLNLYGNDIKAAGARHLAEALKTNKSLASIDLAGDPFVLLCIGGDEGAVHIAEMLKINRTLTSINVENNALNEHVITMLQEAAGVHTFLEV